MNWYYVFTIAVIACGGIPKGYDEGGFSASITLKSFQKDFHTEKSEWKHDATGLANRTANITSFGVLGAAFGALISLFLNDRFGRLRCWQLFVLTWACGLLMQVFSTGVLGVLYFARIVSGLGAGGLTVVGPLYLSEIARARNRGKIVSMYMVFLLSFLSLGFFVNYGASKGLSPTERTQYRLVQSIPLIPVGIAFIGSFFLTDTPRWLASQDRMEDAMMALSRLRKVDATEPQLAEEYHEILHQCQAKEQRLKEAGFGTILKEIFAHPSFRKRFFLGIFIQTVAQWSGGNGITYYITNIFGYAGIKSANLTLITGGAYGLVKLAFTMVFTWGLVDFFGRRRCAITGVSVQCVTHIYMSIYMAKWKGTDNVPASNAAIASVFIYAVGWSIGLCTVPYIYSTEIYPTRIRSVCYAINMGVHWFFQFAVVRVTPNMFVALDIYGAYIFWAMICFIGAIGLFIAMPETKRVPMERMEELFSGRWYMAWRAKVDTTPIQHFGTTKSSAPYDDKYPTSEVERV